MKKQTGRKAVVILSDGVDRGSKVSMTEAIEHAQRADTLVYSILFTGHDEHPGGFGGFGAADSAAWGGAAERDAARTKSVPMAKGARTDCQGNGRRVFRSIEKASDRTDYDQIQEELPQPVHVGLRFGCRAHGPGIPQDYSDCQPEGRRGADRDGYYPAS